jgi:hypothetical protein
MIHGGLDRLRQDVDDIADLAAVNVRLEDPQRWEETA